MPKNKREKARKVSDKIFLAFLRENAGLFAQTARAIERHFKISYSRSAVWNRVMNNPKIKAEWEQIEEANIDIAEAGLNTLMQSKNEATRFKAIQLYLKTKGKSRGFSERFEVTGASGGPLNIQVEVVDGKDKD